MDRTLVAVQISSAVALSHLMQHVEVAKLATAICTQLQEWCDATDKEDCANAHRPHRMDIAAVRLRMAGRSSDTESRGQKRPLETTEDEPSCAA